MLPVICRAAVSMIVTLVEEEEPFRTYSIPAEPNATAFAGAPIGMLVIWSPVLPSNS